MGAGGKLVPNSPVVRAGGEFKMVNRKKAKKKLIQRASIRVTWHRSSGGGPKPWRRGQRKSGHRGHVDINYEETRGFLRFEKAGDRD